MAQTQHRHSTRGSGKLRPGRAAGKRCDVRPSGTYHASDIAGLLQHLCQGGFVAREAPQRGDREVARDSIAKAQPASEQGGSGGRAGGRGRMEVHKPAREGI